MLFENFKRKKLIVANMAEYMKNNSTLEIWIARFFIGMQNTSRLEEIIIKIILEIQTSAIDILKTIWFKSQYLLVLAVKLIILQNSKNFSNIFYSNLLRRHQLSDAHGRTLNL